MLDSRSPSTALGDLVAAGSVLGTLLGYLPYIAAGFGIVWYCLQFWESPLRKRWSARRRLARFERLEREHNLRAAEIEELRSLLSKEKELALTGGVSTPGEKE